MHCVKIFSICLMAVLIAVSHSKQEIKSTRIVGGGEINIDKAPYIVQLRHEKKGFFCGGSLIGDRYVVTAAHCLDKVNYLEIIVVGGASKLTDAGIQRRVVDAFISADYDVVTNDSDVVLLKLDSDMKGKNIKIIPMCTHSLKVGDYLQVSGWGFTKQGGDLSQQLRTVRVPVIDQETCVKWHFKGEVTDNMMCAAEAGKDACTSDSGGPAVFEGELCGIVSWGIGCAKPNNPGVYTRVNQVRWFIIEAMAM